MGLGDKDRAPVPQAVVKPQVLTHLIEGFVIQEGAEPFPVSADWGRSDVCHLKYIPQAVPFLFFLFSGGGRLLVCSKTETLPWLAAQRTGPHVSPDPSASPCSGVARVSNLSPFLSFSAEV